METITQLLVVTFGDLLLLFIYIFLFIFLYSFVM